MTKSAEDFIASQLSLNKNTDIRHYGIKGMKWGRRRPRGKDGRVTNGPAPTNSRDRRRSQREADRSTRPASRMSDQELRNRVNRLQVERQYAELMKAPPRKTNPGVKFVQDVLVTSGKSVATTYATKILSEAVGAGLRKSSNPILKAAGEANKKKK